MAILTDHDIRELCIREHDPFPLLDPFSEGVQGNDVISYGLSHAGYDLRLGNKVLIFKNTRNEVIDPKKFKSDQKYWDRLFDTIADIADHEPVWVPPQSYILGYSVEYIRMPRHIKGTCVGKSTLARCGIHINTTPLEPGWEGHLTIEIANHTPCPVKVYCGEGIAQLEFHTLTGDCLTDYAAKDGKYNRQEASPIPARTKE